MNVMILPIETLTFNTDFQRSKIKKPKISTMDNGYYQYAASYSMNKNTQIVRLHLLQTKSEQGLLIMFRDHV